MFIFSGCNPLRRWPSPQTAKEHLWPKLDLIVSVNFRMSTSTLWSDIVLPAASYYEKYGVKYGVSAMPYIVPASGPRPSPWASRRATTRSSASSLGGSASVPGRGASRSP